MKTLKFVILIMLMPFCAAIAQDAVEKVLQKDKLTREEIKKKDEERRARILKKFADFQNRVKNFAPDLKINIPVNPDKTDDIIDNDHAAKIKKQKEYSAYVADTYKLRSLPYDSIKEFTGEVKRGDKVTVLMKPDLSKSKSYPTITKNWLLIRTPDGTEGYIPTNLLLNNKPGSVKKNASIIYDYELTEQIAGIFNDILIIPAQYSGSGSGGKTMKVNTSVLKVRSDPSLSSETVGSLSKNEVVEVLEYSSHSETYNGISSKWARIKTDNLTGWVFAYYLVASTADGGAVKEDLVSHLAKGASLYVKSDILRVRDAPDDLGTVVFSLQNKDKVSVLEIESEEVSLGGKKSKWVKIKYLDYEGWVFGAFLSKDKNAYEEGDDINNLFQVPITDGYFVSSKFGKRILAGKASTHNGIDLAAPCGTNVVASADGTVIYVHEDSRNCTSCGYGNHVIIEHKNGYRSVYGHLTSISVKMGQKLNSGEKVGTVGNTGHSYGCHLHFEIRSNEEFVDPMNYIHP
jgi:murein DD-endopeptidase MepM/ murein hydrolase activator NlpD